MFPSRAVVTVASLGLVICGLEPWPGDAATQEPARASLALFAPDRTVPIDTQFAATGSPRQEVVVYRMSFASPGGGRVTGFLAHPSVGGRLPGVVMLHGLPGTAEQAMTYQGLDFAARGAVVIAIDAPWARRGGLPDFTPRDSAEQVQLMHDLQRAVDVLVARSDVDPARLAYVGGSYGGAMGALFVSIEKRLKAAILFVPDGGLVEHFTNADGTTTGPLADQDASVQKRWLQAMRPIEPIRFVSEAPATTLLIQNGATDALVTSDDAARLHAVLKEPKTVKWYDGGHGLTPEARADRVAFLAEHLGIRR